METMCCELLGKAEAKGNGCGQTIVLESEERKVRRVRRRKKSLKKKDFLNLNHLPMHTHMCMHT